MHVGPLMSQKSVHAQEKVLEVLAGRTAAASCMSGREALSWTEVASRMLETDDKPVE